MKRAMRGTAWVAAFALLSFALVGCGNKSENTATESNAPAGASRSAAPGFPARPAVETVAIPADTPLAVVLDQSISTQSASAGQEFDASLIEPVMVGGKVVIPRDARAKGHVVESNSSGRLTHRAHLALTLDSVEVGGKTYDVHTTTIGRESSSHKKRNLVIIGGTSALGAIIGGVAGGGKGAAIGAAAGAGAGTAGAAITGKKQVALPAESRLTFRLTEPVKVEVRSKAAS
jgi:outer membrane lipoprotein SlyB